MKPSLATHAFSGALALSAALLTVLTGAGGASAEDICHRNSPSAAADVRGYTWTGTVAKIYTIPFEEVSKETIIVFSIDHVYANAQKPDFPADQTLAAGVTFKLASLCNGPIGFDTGKRYLASTSMLTTDGSSTNLFVAWHLAGDQALLVDMYEQGHVWASLETARSLNDALALVAPEAMPPTDSKQLGPVSTTQTPVWPIAVMAAVAAVAMVLRRRGLQG